MLIICALQWPSRSSRGACLLCCAGGQRQSLPHVQTQGSSAHAARHAPYSLPATREHDRTQAAKALLLRAGTPSKPAAGRRLAALAAASHTQAIRARGRRKEYGVCRWAPHWRRAPGAPSVRRHSPVRPPGHHVVSTLPPPAASVTTTLRSSQLSNARCSSSCAPGPPPLSRVSTPAGLRSVSGGVH